MMLHTHTTEKGNTISSESASEAKRLAEILDAMGCTNCTNCFNCINVTNSVDCVNCIDCDNCIDCSGCINCLNCNGCSVCIDCYNCDDCDGLRACHDCSSQPIVLGSLDNYECYARILTNRTIEFQMGCRTKSYLEAIKYWQGKEHREEIYAALQFVAQLATLRGLQLT